MDLKSVALNAKWERLRGVFPADKTQACWKTFIVTRREICKKRSSCQFGGTTWHSVDITRHNTLHHWRLISQWQSRLLPSGVLVPKIKGRPKLIPLGYWIAPSKYCWKRNVCQHIYCKNIRFKHESVKLDRIAAAVLTSSSNTSAPPDTRGNKTVHIYSGYILFWSPPSPAECCPGLGVKTRDNCSYLGKLCCIRFAEIMSFRKECPPGTRDLWLGRHTHPI